MFSIPAIWAALKPWQGWQRIGAGLKWLFASPVRLCLILAVAMAAVAYAEHRSAAKWQAQAVKVARTLTDERAAAQAAKAKAEQHYKDLAHDADQNHDALVAQGDARLAAYIASHRVRGAAQANPASAAQGGNPTVPESPAQSPVVEGVTITEDDLKICDANYVYARAAHDWANGLNP